MKIDTTDSNEQFDKVIDFLKQDISSLRTGRATPALLDDIMVEAYGTKQQLKALATITVSDAKTLLIDPWDKSVMQDIEIAIRNSSLGLSPVVDGTTIRLILPDLSQERRQELIKLLSVKLEKARISIRKNREDVRDIIDKELKDKEISDDDKYKLQDELEKKVKVYNEKIKTIGEVKEKDILTV